MWSFKVQITPLIKMCTGRILHFLMVLTIALKISQNSDIFWCKLIFSGINIEWVMSNCSIHYKYQILPFYPGFRGTLMYNPPDQFNPNIWPFTLLTQEMHTSALVWGRWGARLGLGRLYTIVWQTRIETLSCTFHKWIFF